MGYLARGLCWATQAEATGAFYGSVDPVQVSATTNTVAMFNWTGSAWNYNKYSVNSSGVWTQSFSTAAPVLSFPDCTVVNDQTTNFNDGMTLGWGVAAAMVAAWGIKFLADRLK